MKNKFNFKSIILTLTLLTLGVGQMWAAWYVPGTIGGTHWGVTDNAMSGTPPAKTFSAVAKGTYDFQLTNGSNWSGNSCLTSIVGPLYNSTTNGSNARFSVAIVCDVTLHVNNTTNWKVTATGKWSSSKTYYVAGDNALVGANWSVNSTKGKFVSSKVTFTGVAAGTYAFKLTDGTNWSADNIDLVTSVSGTVTGHTTANNNMQITVSQKSDVTFTQGDNGSLTVSGVPYRYIAGDSWGGMGEWSTTTTQMTYDSGTSTYSKTFSDVTAAAHKFKITYYNTWTDAVGYSANVSCVNGTVQDDGTGNIQFTPYVAGDVTITYNGTNTVITCTAPTVTFDKEGGDGGVDSQSTPYGTTTSNVTTPSKTGYNFGGYYDGDDGTGNQIINASGVWQKNKTNFTDNSSTAKWIVTSNQTLHAKWTEKTYSLTFSCTNGTIKVNGTNVASGSTASVNHFTTKTLVATPSSGYRFTGWTLSGSNTSYVTIADASAASTTIKATKTGATVTANFEALPNGQLDIVAGANGTVKKESGSWGSSASYTDINDDSDLNIYAKANTGYHFVNWTKSGDGSIKTNAATGVYTLPGRGSATVTANFAETQHNVTVQYKCGSTVIKTATTKSNVGEVTATSQAAPAIAGYNFSTWTIESGITKTSGALTDNTLYFKTNSSGTYTITANYTEDLTTPYVIKGGSAITGSDWTEDIPFTKKSGESTGTIAYAEIPISAAVGDDAQTAYNLKVYNNSNSHWVGLNEGSGDWWYYSNSGEKTLTDNAGNNIQLRANVVGTYIVKLDYTTAASPKITITWPVALSIYRSNPTDGTNIGDHAWSSLSSTTYRWDIDLEANTTYEFKINDKGAYYGHATLINTGFTDRTFATGTVDTKLQTKSAGRFVITYNSSNHKVSVVYPKSVVAGASPVSVYTGGTTTLTGYASELGSGSHTITYEFYKGTTLTDAYKVGAETNTVDATYQQASHDVTVDFDGNATSQVYTVQIKEGGVVLGTNTVTVYRKWDIYVHDVDSWNAMYYYVYDNASGDHREDWPGLDYSSNKITGSTTWYIVTLDAQYPHFILDNNAGNKQTWGNGVYENDITDFATGTYWYVEYKETTAGKRYYDLHSIEITDPTVTLSASIANSKNITLTGNVTNCGGDGMFASDMKEVYFEVAGTKNAATTVSTTAGTFTKTLTNATAGATNTLQAFAENIHGTGSSSVLHYTNVTLDRQGGTTGTTAVTAVENMAMPAGATVPGKTGYTFGGYYASEGGSGKQYYNASMGSANNWDQTSKDKTIFAKWTAITYRVHFNGNGNTGGSMDDQTGITYDSETTLTANAFEKTGYNFAGWATTQERATAGTVDRADGAAHGNLASTQGATAELWAVWTPKQCALTFDYQTSAAGYGASGTISASSSATYDAAMPSLTGNMPTAANGYCFMGFYGETGGNGTKYYNADKSSAHNWDVDTESGTTLYAYYKKAEITAITLNSSILDPVDAGEGWVIANPTIAPTPEGTTKICWELLYDNDNPVPSGHDARAYTEGDTKPNQVRFSITGLAASRYKIKATLRTGSSCDGGDELSTRTQTFTIASSFTVNILYQDDDNNNIAPGTTSPGKATDWTTISAPDIFGYSFVGWNLGEGITTEDPTDKQNDFRFKASYYGTIVAQYTKNQYIYLDLSQTFSTYGKWNNPYVYFYNGDPWVDNKGAGAKDGDKTHTHYISGHAMTKIDGTDIWYFDYGGVSGATRYVAFTWGDKTMQENFNATDVIFRGDFSESTPLFVPATDGTAESRKTDVNGAQYYNKGYWVTYLGEPTGYTLLVYNSAGDVQLKSEPFIAADKRMTMTSTVELDASSTYKIEVLRNDGYWYKAASNFTASSLGPKPILPDGTKNAIQTNADGIYTFTLGYNSGNLQLSVVYPSSIGDFRIAYTDNATWSHSHTLESWILPSKAITHRANGIDTVSFFISKGDGITPKIRWQKVTGVSTSSVTWGTTVGTDCGAWLTTGYTDVSEAGVYNFKVTQNADGTSIASIERIGEYDGSYYIRCNALRSKWDHYTIDSDHRMTYSEFSESAANSFGEKYSHYKAKWCPRNTNIAFVIANDYSPCLTDKLTQDVGGPAFNNLEADGTLKYEKTGGGDMKYDDASAYLDKYSANVRFMWNRKTNKISRAYVSAATSNNAKFLVLQGSGTSNSNIYNGTTGSAFTADPPGANSVILKDDQNWIYEEVIKANPSALVKLYANYCDQTQWFRGADGTPFEKNVNAIELLGGSPSSSKYAVRVIYDFKTNRLVCAWMPEGASQEIETNLTVNADVMVIREHQGSAQCITFANDKSMTGVKTVYGAMKFNRWILSNRAHPEDTNPDHCRESNLGADLANFHPVLPIGQQLSIYERSLYFISFPFNVKASEIFGFGHYWDEWYLEYYDGETRAKNGYWKDSPPNWKYVTPDMLEDFTLMANEGYILGLDLDFMQVDNTAFWSNGISTVELYFPSTVNLETLKQTNVTIPALSSDYKCTINRGTPEGDRRVKDSYWRCLGVPSFNIYNSALKDGSGNTIEWKTDYTWHADESEFPFIYMWNKADNTLTPQATSTFTFLPMHAYLVQNGGEINWTAVSAKPSSIVARRVNEQPQKEYNWDLTLVCDSQLIDRTYIRMSNLEQVTDTFDFGQDLNKEFNKTRSNIYTFIGYEQVAANSMPMQTEQTTIVSVGVNILSAGDYTFAMPEGTMGVGITLIDTETGVRTNLGLMDYTVTLTKGDYTNRFLLEIPAVSNVATDIELINGENGDASLNGVRKVLIDNKLFLIKDGEVYDARGAKVK